MQMSIQYSEELQAFIEKNSGSRGDTSAFRKREESEKTETGVRALRGTVWWKLLKPARVIYNYSRVIWINLRRYGFVLTLSKAKDKLVMKRKLKNFSKYYIQSILPDEKTRASQRATKFDRAITFSILVPLYNTPEKYLREMIDSVREQTSENWQLCLADGSDAEHAYVEEICKS